MIHRGVRHFVLIVAVAALAAYAFIYARGLADEPIRSDGYSYYVYLPSAFIYHDLTFDTLSRALYGGAYPDFTAMRRWPSTGRWFDAVPIGVAVLMLPFFLVADTLTWWSNFPRDGFSFYYQYLIGLAGLTYFLAGLALVRAMLRRHFSDGVVLATLATITFGTNLFHYGTYDATFSHAYSFCLIAAWLVAVDRWWRDPALRVSCATGGIAALIVLVRNVNAVFLLLLPLYGVTSWNDLRARAAALWARRRPLLAAAAIGALCLAPQFWLYRSATGAWMVNSYSLLSNRFEFGSPRILAVLFSTQKGLFFWSPAILLAVAGVFVARGWARGLALAAIVIFVAQSYLVASWTDWQLGGSFGHRAFTDGFALVAPMMASAFAWTSTRPAARVFVTIAVTAAVLLSIAQMLQYWFGILPIIDTSWTQYRELFLRFQ